MISKINLISAIIFIAIVMGITAHAHDPAGGSRRGYSTDEQIYGMMGGRGTMGDSGSDNGMMHDYGHDDKYRYNRESTDNYRRNRRGCMNEGDSSDHYRQRHGYDRYHQDTETHYRRNLRDNRKDDLDLNGDIESFVDQNK